jgi:hypothetical protein
MTLRYGTSIYLAISFCSNNLDFLLLEKLFFEKLDVGKCDFIFKLLKGCSKIT